MKKIILSFAVVILGLVSCEPYDDRLQIENKSDHCIYIMFSSIQNDTSWYSDKCRFIGNSSSIIVPDGTMKIDMIGNYDQEAKQSPNKIFYFWFIKESFLIKYRDYKIADTLLIKRKAFRYKELQQMNWVVTYP